MLYRCWAFLNSNFLVIQRKKKINHASSSGVRAVCSLGQLREGRQEIVGAKVRVHKLSSISMYPGCLLVTGFSTIQQPQSSNRLGC